MPFGGVARALCLGVLLPSPFLLQEKHFSMSEKVKGEDSSDELGVVAVIAVSVRGTLRSGGW